MMRPCISLTSLVARSLSSLIICIFRRDLSPFFHCLAPYFFISPYSMIVAFPMNLDGAKIEIHSALFVLHCDNVLSACLAKRHLHHAHAKIRGDAVVPYGRDVACIIARWMMLFLSNSGESPPFVYIFEKFSSQLCLGAMR